MKTETKFNVSDKVWTILDGKASEFPIDSIKVTFRKGLTGTDLYLNVNINGGYDCKIVEERHCFHSKEELINSL